MKLQDRRCYPMLERNWCPSDMTRCRNWDHHPSPPPPRPPPLPPLPLPPPSPPPPPPPPPLLPQQRMCSCTSYANLNGASKLSPMCQKPSSFTGGYTAGAASALGTMIEDVFLGGSCMPVQASCPSDHFFCLQVRLPHPPPSPPSRLSQYAPSSIQRAILSTTLIAGLLYPASNAIDGNVDTRAVTRKRQGNWISVELPDTTAVA